MTRTHPEAATAISDMLGGQQSAPMHFQVLTPPPRDPSGPSAAFLITTTRSVLPSGG